MAGRTVPQLDAATPRSGTRLAPLFSPLSWKALPTVDDPLLEKLKRLVIHTDELAATGRLWKGREALPTDQVSYGSQSTSVHCRPYAERTTTARCGEPALRPCRAANSGAESVHRDCRS